MWWWNLKFHFWNTNELQVSLPKYNKTWYNSYYVLTPWLSLHDQVRVLNELEYLFEKIDEIPSEKLPFWIVCIVKNEAVTILRKNQRTVQLENWDSFAADAESVTDYLGLVQLFSRLPETYRAVLEMRLLLGYTGKECSCTVEKQQQKQNKDSRPAAIPSKRDTGSFCNFFMKSIENYNAVCYNVLEQ